MLDLFKDKQPLFYEQINNSIKNNKITHAYLIETNDYPESDSLILEFVKELILAFKPSIEGETTSLYIKRILGDMNLSITKIASGIPMGADMEYIDAMTLERALMDRKNVE